jgi:hypothetical protein
MLRNQGMAQWARISTGAAVVTFGLAFFASSCGPIEYVGQVTRKASSQVAAAKAVEADKYSPYYYTLATEYLHKAREEAAAADFQAANRFGRKSEQAARKAKAEAIARAGQPIEKFHPKEEETGGGKLAPLDDAEETEELAPLDDGESDAEEDGEEDGDDEEESDSKSDDEEVPPGLGGD